MIAARSWMFGGGDALRKPSGTSENSGVAKAHRDRLEPAIREPDRSSRKVLWSQRTRTEFLHTCHGPRLPNRREISSTPEHPTLGRLLLCPSLNR